MKRHWPEGDLMETEVNARVAESSRMCDSAASVGRRTPPARETGTGVVGLPDAMGGDAGEVGAGAAMADDAGV